MTTPANDTRGETLISALVDRYGAGTATGPVAPAPVAWLASVGLRSGVAPADLATPLTGQLGALWRGFDALSAPRRLVVLLLASALAGADYDKHLVQTSGKAAGDPSLAQAERGLDAFSGAAADLCEKASEDHAYETTVILALMTKAWSGNGTGGTRYFGWLRHADPTLWAMIDDFGRPSRRLDAIAVVYHYRIERLRKKPVGQSFPEEAADHIRDYARDHIVQPARSPQP